MIACVEKTAQNADFYQIIDYLTGLFKLNTSLLVDPDLIGPWLQQFWATASLRVINDVPHIRATVAGKKVLISEEIIRADLLFVDADGVDCFPKQYFTRVLAKVQGMIISQGTADSTGYAEAQWYAESHSMAVKLTLGESKKQKNPFSSQTDSQLKALLKKICQKWLEPVVIHHHLFWGEVRTLRSKRDEERSKGRRCLQSNWGRNKDEGTLSEEHYVQEDYTADLFFEDIVDKLLQLLPDLERKSGGLIVINIEEKKAYDCKSGDTEVTRFGGSSNSTARTAYRRKKKGQGYKNLQKLKYPQMKELYDKVQESIKDSFKDFIPMDSEREKQMLKERDEKRLLRKRKATISEEQPSKKLKLRTETIDELRNYLRIVDFEKNAQDRESLEGISMITELQVIDSPDGEYLIIHRANNHFRAFDTLWEILHILDRQDLYHLYRVVQDYYEHISPTGLGLILLGDLTTIWETAEISDDDFWKNQEDWEIVRWRLNESSGVHTLELEDGTMIHMLAERRYPLSRELMIRMLDHGMEVEDESEIAIAVIHLFILWTTEDGDDS
ncbi:hypothetical protein Tco_0402046 [Tanacetum coccineum]